MKVYIFVISFLIIFTACNNKPAKTDAADDGYYTCSMHPQVMQPTQGKCPICGMGLIFIKNSKSVNNDEIKLSAEQLELSNIRVDTIEDGMLGNDLVMTATLNFDQSKITAINSKVMGRIDKLYFKNQGDYVKKGDRLYDLYSDDLNNAKQEYILSIQKKSSIDPTIIDFDQLIRSAKNKLLLWGLTESEILHLAITKEVGATTTFYSNFDGFITSIDAKEGAYVMEGGAILRLADLSTLWVEAQVYNSELSNIDKNAVAEVKAGESVYKSKIEFTNGEVSPDTRVNLIRLSIPNANNKLRPGMSASVTIKNPGHKMLSLPIDAVLRDGKGATVWLRTKTGTFKNKMVETGMETGDRIEIKSGLTNGDEVVITGAYLLNSEYIFKNGANPMDGMKM